MRQPEAHNFAVPPFLRVGQGMTWHGPSPSGDNFPSTLLLDSGTMQFLSAIIRIVIIDLVLSGDNAVVIGMAAHRLEPRQRRTAILFGGAAAIVLRISLTAIAALLMQISGLRLVGGLL